MTRIRFALALALAGVVVALAGCSAPVAGPGTPPPSEPGAVAPGSLRPLLPATDPAATVYCPQVDAVALTALGLTDAVTEIDAIYRCGIDVDSLAADGSAGAQFVDELIGGAEELITAYSLPSSTTPAEMCIMMLADPAIIWVEVGGERYAVHAPVDDCGFPIEQALDALEAAVFERLVTVESDDVAP